MTFREQKLELAIKNAIENLEPFVNNGFGTIKEISNELKKSLELDNEKCLTCGKITGTIKTSKRTYYCAKHFPLPPDPSCLSKVDH